jgi:RNA ligase (TIGR02306 family)
MGMLLPAPEGSNIGDDVAEQLGITHYEPPAMDEIEGSRKHAGSDVAPPPPLIYAPKYDLESVYSFAEAFEPGEMVYISEKIDGQNSRYVFTPGVKPGYEVLVLNGEKVETRVITPEESLGGQIHAGSRTEWKTKEGGSNWWRALDQNPWIEKWIQSNPEQVLYGEIFGWVQSLKYGAKQGQLFFRAFDVLRGMEYIDAEEFISVMPEDHRAPSLGIMPFNFEELQKLADGPSLVPGAANMREGIVIKPLRERQHWKLGRVSLKMVSNAYLEKSAR